MATSRVDPYANFNFLVEIDRNNHSWFPGSYRLEHRGGSHRVPRGEREAEHRAQFPGLIKYSPIVLKRGFTQDNSLWNWFQSVLDGNVHRATEPSLCLTLLITRCCAGSFRRVGPASGRDLFSAASPTKSRSRPWSSSTRA